MTSLLASEEEPPHEALYLSLAYFPVRELLVTSETCRLMRDAVRSDDGVLPWQNVVVDKPLSRRFNDASLQRVASMARGKLRTLALIDCPNITDDGLQSVLHSNPLIHKIIVPGCTGLTPEGIIRALTKHHTTLNTLHINGIYNIQNHHIQTLHSLLQLKNTPQSPQYYNRARDYRRQRNTIDVEICPKCDTPRAVFSCPRKSCSVVKCRGCTACVPRCKECGVCVDAREELEEVLCDDILCLDCWLRLPKCCFCNKPYCKQHAEDRQSWVSSAVGSGGFVCDVCVAKFVDH